MTEWLKAALDYIPRWLDYQLQHHDQPGCAVAIAHNGELALEQLASKRFPLELVTTHKFGLKDVDLAIRSVGNKGVPGVIHASLMPWE